MNGETVNKILDSALGCLILVSIIFALEEGEMIFYFLALVALIALIGPASGMFLAIGVDKALNRIR